MKTTNIWIGIPTRIFIAVSLFLVQLLGKIRKKLGQSTIELTFLTNASYLKAQLCLRNTVYRAYKLMFMEHKVCELYNT